MSDIQRERDLVLNPNEYAYVLDKTKGLISCIVGSYKMSLSNSDALVVFNERIKRFEEAGFSEAITTFVVAPENWYVVLKNPDMNNKHPIPGTANSLPDLKIGKKVNICGNTSFALYPGQMAKIIQGHRLRSNQYLLAKVYDANATELEGEYETGQILVIKGTEVSFYIPPTGIEVIPVDEGQGKYVRDAITLEKLEYCILKNEEGDRKYVHGSAVVFPNPDEVFVPNPKGGYKFKAIELSEISGIYVKVVSSYEENGIKHAAGEELFITGKEQKIYYPRPEHAIIDYEGKIIHHAIAIPEGEGRYILERKTGKIKMVKGAAMYLVNPIEEVVVRRKLTPKQCQLWYPENKEVMEYNNRILVEENKKSQPLSIPHVIQTSCYSNPFLQNVFKETENAVIDDFGFSRGNVYSKPRTITFDNKYDGVVSIEVWTGYAINVVSKNGNRKIITGPTTYLMEYDEILEVMELSTGKPKTTDELLRTVYLRVDNNKISDIINVETKDFVSANVKVSYCVDFLPDYKEKWFGLENYVKYLCDRLRSLLKREAKKYSVEEFYLKASDIIRDTVLGGEKTREDKIGRLFVENGMFVHDVEILSLKLEGEIQEIIDLHQKDEIKKTLDFSSEEKELEITRKLSEFKKEKADLEYRTKHFERELKNKLKLKEIEYSESERRAEEESKKAEKEAEENMQKILDAIQQSELARKKKLTDSDLYKKEKNQKLESENRKAYTDDIKKVLDAITPDLVASMNSKSNAELMETLATSMSPYAIAGGESISDVTNRLLRGTSLEKMLEKTLEKISISE